MVEIIATVESIEQAKQLLPYVDTIFFGEETFGLRLPTSFSREEQSELIRPTMLIKFLSAIQESFIV